MEKVFVDLDPKAGHNYDFFWDWHNDIYRYDAFHPQEASIPLSNFSKESARNAFKKLFSNLPFKREDEDSLIDKILEDLSFNQRRRRLVVEPENGFIILNLIFGKKHAVAMLKYIFYDPKNLMENIIKEQIKLNDKPEAPN